MMDVICGICGRTYPDHWARHRITTAEAPISASSVMLTVKPICDWCRESIPSIQLLGHARLTDCVKTAIRTWHIGLAREGLTQPEMTEDDFSILAGEIVEQLLAEK